VDRRSGKTLKYPGGFAVINEERLPIRRHAPEIGEHNAEVYADELGLLEGEITELAAAGVI
jgi:formyl-CoA transferase